MFKILENYSTSEIHSSFFFFFAAAAVVLTGNSAQHSQRSLAGLILGKEQVLVPLINIPPPDRTNYP